MTQNKKAVCLTIKDVCGLLDITMHGIEGLSNNQGIADLVNKLARSIVARVAVNEDGSISPREANLAVTPSLSE